MREGDAVGRGERLVDALLAWLTPARRLGPEVNRFQVLVSDDGDIQARALRRRLKRGRVRSPPAGSV